MAGSAADPAALLRIYIKRGRLEDAASLALTHLHAWQTQVTLALLSQYWTYGIDTTGAFLPRGFISTFFRVSMLPLRRLWTLSVNVMGVSGSPTIFWGTFWGVSAPPVRPPVRPACAHSCRKPCTHTIARPCSSRIFWNSAAPWLWGEQLECWSANNDLESYD